MTINTCPAFQQAEAEVQRLTDAWHNCPPVTVVQSTTDLPFAAPDDVRGAYLPRTKEVFIVANPRHTSRVASTMAHEIVAHHGLRVELGQHWRSFMLAVQSGVRAGDWRLASFRDDVRASYTDENGNCNLSPALVSDEMAAAIVESRFHVPSGRMRMLQPFRKRMTAAAGHFHRELLYRDAPVSYEELQGVILAAEHRLRHGDGFFGIGFRLRRWYAPPMAFDPYKPPMSIEESERMLTAEDNERSAWSNFWCFLYMLPGYLLLLAFVAGLGAAFFAVVRLLG